MFIMGIFILLRRHLDIETALGYRVEFVLTRVFVLIIKAYIYMYIYIDLYMCWWHIVI